MLADAKMEFGEKEMIDLEKVCFICLTSGDPIADKLKNVTEKILSKSRDAIQARNKQPESSRLSIDISTIKLPDNLEKNNKYHQKCFRSLTNLSGKNKIDEQAEDSEDESLE